MLAEYFPILVFLGISTAMGVSLVVIGGLLGPRRLDSEKLSPYECGFEAFEDSRMKFDVRYYLIAILFIIFDLEIAFFIPWAIALDMLGMFGLAAMTIFVLELIIGFFVVWKRGALEWE
jgi:NADH-quinone oxidoreductase subunit A